MPPAALTPTWRPVAARKSRAASSITSVAAGVAAYHDTKFRELKPFADVVPLLSALRAAGVTTGIVTHGWTTKQAEKIVRLGLLPHLDTRAVFISEQLGISKPNPKIYALALRDLGLQPPEAMYVGDSPSHDVTPPKSLVGTRLTSFGFARSAASTTCKPVLVPPTQT